MPILIAADAPERDLVEILSADIQTADALALLVVARRRLAGEPVRAPAEVLEVAADVCKDIDRGENVCGLVARHARAGVHEAAFMKHDAG